MVGVNFQKASCALDASVKIYSYRVDDVWSASYRVLQNLNRTDAADAEEPAAPGQDESDGEEDGARQPKRKAAPRGETTLAANDVAITANIQDIVAHVDPLFHKTALSFDEAGASGLLLNTLQLHGGVVPAFDSDAAVNPPVADMLAASAEQVLPWDLGALFQQGSDAVKSAYKPAPAPVPLPLASTCAAMYARLTGLAMVQRKQASAPAEAAAASVEPDGDPLLAQEHGHMYDFDVGLTYEMPVSAGADAAEATDAGAEGQVQPLFYDADLDWGGDANYAADYAPMPSDSGAADAVALGLVNMTLGESGGADTPAWLQSPASERGAAPAAVPAYAAGHAVSMQIGDAAAFAHAGAAGQWGAAGHTQHLTDLASKLGAPGHWKLPSTLRAKAASASVPTSQDADGPAEKAAPRKRAAAATEAMPDFFGPPPPKAAFAGPARAAKSTQLTGVAQAARAAGDDTLCLPPAVQWQASELHSLLTVATWSVGALHAAPSQGGDCDELGGGEHALDMTYGDDGDDMFFIGADAQPAGASSAGWGPSASVPEATDAGGGIKYAKRAKKVDVRELKARVWRRVHETLQLPADYAVDTVEDAASKPLPSDAQVDMQDVIGEVAPAVSDAVTGPFYLITLLHLANEHGLCVETDRPGHTQPGHHVATTLRLCPGNALNSL